MPEIGIDSGLGTGLGGLGPAAAVAGHGLLHVLGEVVPQMPAVRDLHGVRRAAAGALGVGAGAVAAHHLHPGMRT